MKIEKIGHFTDSHVTEITSQRNVPGKDLKPHYTSLRVSPGNGTVFRSKASLNFEICSPTKSGSDFDRVFYTII